MRVITLRRADACSVCNARLAPGVRAGWDPAARTTTCTACLAHSEAVLERGVAGASVARTYERRSERYRQQQEAKVAADRAWRVDIKAQRPLLGRVAAAVTPRAQLQPEPAHVRSWGQGAPGEVRVGQVLDDIEGVIALHDRRVPGTRANIDHIAVSPGGVWVIDAKRYLDASVERRDVGGWLRTDERLYVGGRDRTKLVDAMGWQVEAVKAALAGLDVEVKVRPMLCFAGSSWGWLAKPFEVRGVTVARPLALGGLLGEPGTLRAELAERLARHASIKLPSA